MITVYRVRFQERVLHPEIGEWVSTGETLRFAYYATRAEAEAAILAGLTSKKEPTVPILETRTFTGPTPPRVAISSRHVKVGDFRRGTPKDKELNDQGLERIVNLKDRPNALTSGQKARTKKRNASKRKEATQ